MRSWLKVVSVAILVAFAPAIAACSKPSWPHPDPEKIADGPHKAQILYGESLIRNTHALIGPSATDPSMRYAGNNLDCASCHLDSGRKQFALSYVGVAGAYPRFMARENKTRTLAERVNGCLERSMNGRGLAEDSREMKAIIAYIGFLSASAPKTLKGRGSPPLPLLGRAADPVRGETVYATVCTACHGADGLGVKNDTGGYIYPPLWGPDSFNTGAGMHRLITAAQFVHANMPFGVSFESPSLSAEDAWDVAAYINSKPRPEKPGLDRDYPDRRKKPVDAPFPPYADDFSVEQHRLGPFQPIIDAQKQDKKGAPIP